MGFINAPMFAQMSAFLKKFDSYGYKKIKCEELLETHAKANAGTMQVVALRLADVIGPYDESFRLWKYVTWIKTLLGLQTRLVDPDDKARVQARKIKYEQVKDTEKKLSITFSIDVVKTILRLIDT